MASKTKVSKKKVVVEDSVSNQVADQLNKAHLDKIERQKKAVPVVNDKSDTHLSRHSFEELKAWRDTASKRIDDNEVEFDKLFLDFESIGRKLGKLEKKIINDKKWCKILNRVLYKKIFKDRPHR